MTSQREKGAERALDRLGRDRFTNFIRAIRQDKETLAVSLMNKILDAGHDLDSIFHNGEKYGYFLSVRRIEKDQFKIEFGCIAGHLAGDGGAWEVLFEPDGSISTATNVDRWIY